MARKKSRKQRGFLSLDRQCECESRGQENCSVHLNEFLPKEDVPRAAEAELPSWAGVAEETLKSSGEAEGGYLSLSRDTGAALCFKRTGKLIRWESDCGQWSIVAYSSAEMGEVFRVVGTAIRHDCETLAEAREVVRKNSGRVVTVESA